MIKKPLKIILNPAQIVRYSEGRGVDQLLINVATAIGRVEVYEQPLDVRQGPKFLGLATLPKDG